MKLAILTVAALVLAARARRPADAPRGQGGLENEDDQTRRPGGEGAVSPSDRTEQRLPQERRGDPGVQTEADHGEKAAAGDSIAAEAEAAREQRQEPDDLQRPRVEVRGVNPRLPSRNITFKNVGKMSPGTDLAHIVTVIDTADPIQEINKLTRVIDELLLRAISQRGIGQDYETFVNVTCKQYLETIKVTAQALEGLCSIAGCTQKKEESRFQHDLKGVSSMMSLNWLTLARSSRSIWGPLAMGLSLFNSFDTTRLKEDLTDVKRRTKEVAHVVTEQADALAENRRHLKELEGHVESAVKATDRNQAEGQFSRVTAFVNQICINWANWAEDISNSIILRKLNLRTFSVPMLNRAIKEIASKAAQRGFKPVATSAQELFDESLSFVAKDGKITLMLHVDLVHQELLDVYQLVNTPIALRNGQTAFLRHSKSIIALNEEHTEYVEMSGEEMSLCRKRQDLYLCDQGLVAKNPWLSCLGALFKANAQYVRYLCEFTALTTSKEILTQIGDRKVLVYSPPGIATPIVGKCGNQEEAFRELAHDHEIYELSEDCSLESPNYKFLPERHFRINASFVIKEVERVAFEIRNVTIAARGNSEFHTSLTSTKELNALQLDYPRHHKTVLIVLAVAMFLIFCFFSILSVSGAFLWRKFRQVIGSKEAAELVEMLPMIAENAEGESLAKGAYIAAKSIDNVSTSSAPPQMQEHGRTPRAKEETTSGMEAAPASTTASRPFGSPGSDGLGEKEARDQRHLRFGEAGDLLRRDAEADRACS